MGLSEGDLQIPCLDVCHVMFHVPVWVHGNLSRQAPFGHSAERFPTVRKTLVSLGLFSTWHFVDPILRVNL